MSNNIKFKSILLYFIKLLILSIILSNAKIPLLNNDSDNDGIPDYNVYGGGEPCVECEEPELPMEPGAPTPEPPPEPCEEPPCEPPPEPTMEPTPEPTSLSQIDNCIGLANPNQADYDKDGFGNVCDNCPFIYNPDQLDTNGDGIGDVCQGIIYGIDSDGDGIPDVLDNCVNISNPGQDDYDNDTIGNSCDNDIDGDGILNYNDTNADEWPPPHPGGKEGGTWTDDDDDSDNCPMIYNFYQDDIDGDGIGDFVYDEEFKIVSGCDNCWNVSNPDQIDTDGDGWGDACDNCPFVSNPDQKDDDNDGIGNACTPSPTQSPTEIPSFSPTINPSNNPSENPSISPTQYPSINPSNNPSKYPSENPSMNPSNTPTNYPTTSNPTNTPSKIPSTSPTNNPSENPSISPTEHPSNNPSENPSISPSNNPSNSPSKNPTENPSKNPSFSPTMHPSNNPSKYPSNNPSNNPSNPPSKNPTENPTKYPSKYPTKYPSMNPSNNPSKYPTQNPTIPSLTPTNYPSLNPSIQPSENPTKHPITTVEPSITPTKYTYNPTIPPTKQPTFSPTFSPTFAPTESPINDERKFNHKFDIKYAIEKLEIEYIEILVNNIFDIIDKIINIIEQSYFESTNINIKFFKLEIENILGFKIKDINRDKEPHFLYAKDDGIFINSNIKCIGKHTCELLSNSDIDEFKYTFESIVTTKLRIFFTQYLYNLNAEIEESKLIFLIASHSELEILYPISEQSTFKELLFEYAVLVILLCVLIILFILCIFAYVYSKYSMNDSIWFALMIYGLQCAIMCVDINLCNELLRHDQFISDIRITLCGIFAIIFLLIAYGCNLYFAGKITQLIPKQNKYAILFFKEKFIHDLFIILLIICGGCYSVLFLFSSAIFGIKSFDSGLTYFEIKELNKIKIISTICLQNIPMIIIQCVYIASIHTITINTLFAMIFAVLSIICTPFHRNRNNNVFKYYIELKEIKTNNNNSYNIGEMDNIKMNHFKQNKDKITEIQNILSEAFGYTENNIEISRNINIEPNGLTFYMVHFGNNYENINKIIQLYKDTEKYLKSEFKRYFGLNGECIIIFKSIDGSYSIRIDDDDDDDYDYVEGNNNNVLQTTTTMNGKETITNEIIFDTIELQTTIIEKEKDVDVETDVYHHIVLNEEQQEIMREIIVENNSDAGSESDFDFAC